MASTVGARAPRAHRRRLIRATGKRLFACRKNGKRRCGLLLHLESLAAEPALATAVLLAGLEGALVIRSRCVAQAEVAPGPLPVQLFPLALLARVAEAALQAAVEHRAAAPEALERLRKEGHRL